ncbi:bifunctional precorrin-2 dehydrogenase/sirohydrochlorin ferrochelatase [candidate division KSB1 bacterium]
MYPIILDINERPALVIGAGNVGERKIDALLLSGADVTVISEKCPESIRQYAESGKIILIERSYQSGDCAGFFLVIGATDDVQTNETIFRECQELGILVNIVDVPELCTFYVPALVKRGDFQIAVTTGGKSPALARTIRKELEAQFGEEYGVFTEQIGNMRDALKKQFQGNPEERQRAIEEMFSREYRNFRKVRKNSGKSVS